jgi:uncharacterized membrane protein
MAFLAFGLAVKGVTTDPWPRSPVSLHLVPAEVLALTPAAILSLGVIVLILTPVARVLLSMFVFAGERDRLYVLITGIVLLNLAVGMAIALA